MTIELIKKQANTPLKENEYEVVYQGDWKDVNYLYKFGTVTEDGFSQLVMWLDFFSKSRKLERGYKLDIRTDRYECAINYFSDWLAEKGYTDYDNDLIEELAEAFDEDMYVLPKETSSGYGIHSLKITLKKDGTEFELGYTEDDVDVVIKNYLIGNGIISE